MDGLKLESNLLLVSELVKVRIEVIRINLVRSDRFGEVSD